jgi:hypothetical protein
MAGWATGSADDGLLASPRVPSAISSVATMMVAVVSDAVTQMTGVVMDHPSGHDWLQRAGVFGFAFWGLSRDP